ncbi:MAG: hypothetical protein GF344_17180 [Chitinivibrionales bacterium]|nr:hypothetical protein [Chitinivibrionales bacterium]
MSPRLLAEWGDFYSGAKLRVEAIATEHQETRRGLSDVFRLDDGNLQYEG